MPPCRSTHTLSTLIDSSQPSLRVVHNMARAGGTLICRCLGAMQGVRLLSEIHPLGHRNRHFNALAQYQQWYEYPGIDGQSTPGFDRAIDLVYAHCAEQNDHLILRDWAHLDFVGPPAMRAPSFSLTLDARLSGRYRLLHGAIVRHPMETWLSLSKMSVIIDNNILMADFFAGYRRFLDAVRDHTWIRYEDFTTGPVQALSSLCAALEVQFDPGCLERWPDNRRITGDIHNHSRAGDRTEIIHLPIRPIAPDLAAEVAENSDYQEIIDRCQYPF